MTIQVTDAQKQSANGSTYLYVEMQTEKHSALIVVCSGSYSYVRVVVQNAMNRAWRGMGKQFDNADDAIASYKTSAIKAMIQHAVEMAAGDLSAIPVISL